MADRRVGVTGASGHLGSSLLPLLLARGDRVRCLVHRNCAPLGGADVELVPGDVASPETLRRAFGGCEIVFHLAARISITGSQGGRVEATNVQGARNVAEAALACGVRRLVHVNSVHAFDHHPPREPLHEARGRPTPDHPAYDRSKAAGEAEVRAVAARGLEVVIGNPTGIIGPGDHAPSRMGQVFLDLYHRRLPSLLPGGFDWVDARDVAASLVALAERGQSGEGYILGGHCATVRHLAELAAQVTGVAPPRWDCPAWLASLTAPLVAAVSGTLGGEPLYTPEALHAVFKGSREVCCDKARAAVGHTSRPLAESVRDT